MRPLTNALQLLVAPMRGWHSIAQTNASTMTVLLLHTVPLALIPAACWYYGVTTHGWSIAGDALRQLGMIAIGV